MSTECVICWDRLQSSNALLSTPCGHVSHRQCLMEWLRKSPTCPQCRSYVTMARTNPIYLNFTNNDLSNVQNLESRIVNLQRTVEMKDTEIVLGRASSQILTERIASQNKSLHQNTLRIHELETEQKKLTSELTLNIENARKATALLRSKEEKIRHLEDIVKNEQQAYKVQIEKQREEQNKLIKELTAKCAALEDSKRTLQGDLAKMANNIEMQNQQDKLIKKLTAKCSALEKSKRKLESELEKRVNEMTILQKSRAMKGEPLTSTELESEEREKEVATVQEARAVKEEPVPSIEFESEQRENNIATVQEARAVKEKPSKAAKEKPTKAAKEKPSKAAKEKPSKAAKEKPSKAAKENPSNAVKENPSKAVKEKPSKAAKEHPSKAAKEKPSEAKRAPRKALSTIDSNTDTEAAAQNQRYLLRPR